MHWTIFLKWWLQIEKFTKDPREFFGLFVTDKTDSNEKRVFHCADSIDSYEHSDISVFFNSKEKTCNMMGLQYLEKGDILRLKVITSNTAVTISQDKTFFGAVLFSWLDVLNPKFEGTDKERVVSNDDYRQTITYRWIYFSFFYFKTISIGGQSRVNINFIWSHVSVFCDKKKKWI